MDFVERWWQSKLKDVTKLKTVESKKKNLNKYKYNTPETKAEFFKMTGGRCSFCTKKITDFNSEMTVEHIQTKVSTPSKIFAWENL